MSRSTVSGPAVSIVLPTYNREAFLPAAFNAIAGQHFRDWELIVVDDGSTDRTRQLTEEFARSVGQSVHYVYQQNQGPYAARNTGIDRAAGAYVAFYDSDDVWIPHHLSSCAEALDRFPDVDWVYSASEVIDLATGTQLQASCFYEGERPRPFLRLRHEPRGPWRVITDRGAIECQITHGLFCGLQNSVIRTRVFQRLRLATDLRNEAEDQLFAIRALAAGCRLAYVDDVHVKYHVHAGNSSGSATGAGLSKVRRVYEPLIAGYARLATEVPLTARERRALRRRLAADMFWALGYAGFWTAGDRRAALRLFGRALRIWPWSLSQWKTFIVAAVRTAVSPTVARRASGALP